MALTPRRSSLRVKSCKKWLFRISLYVLKKFLTMNMYYLIFFKIMHFAERRKNRTTLSKMKADKESSYAFSCGKKNLVHAYSGQDLRQYQACRYGRIV